MTLKLIFIVAFLLVTAIRLTLQCIHYASAKNKIPDNVADVYDEETYLKWQKYHGEKNRLYMISTAVTSAVLLVFLCFDVHAAVANLFGFGFFAKVMAILMFHTLVSFIISVPFQFIDTMRIEEKYGFNRTTFKTFVRDLFIELAMSFVLEFLLILAIYLTHNALGDNMVYVLAGVMCAFTLLMNYLFPLLNRLQNKFTPLPEGSLRDKLTALLTSHGYTVKEIEVMDASRRTSKSNAYFSGLGKQKKIVLYDTLLEQMDEDEICAVFAHELGHGLHHDILKLLLLNFGSMIMIAVLAWLGVRYEEICEAFGFKFGMVNYGFVYLMLGSAVLPLVQQIYGILTNYISRKAEYRADAQAVTEGYGDALISGLKKLSRENFDHLSPSDIVVVLEYSHPTLSQRISAIEG